MSDKELLERYRMALEAIVKLGSQSGTYTYHLTSVANEALKEKR